jgi:prepilin-type N-terminal cleavage/methylation domain-containing protein
MIPVRKQSAFSLVELSVVLVILGLLVGGVLAGQSLIRAAELRSVLADFSRYNAAFRTFQDKYFALPGDMSNATAFWGIASGTTGADTNCFDVFKAAQPTCNGDGDQRILDRVLGGTHNSVERFLVWQHLANAALVEGSYTGRTNDNTAFAVVPGRNLPLSKSANNYYDIYFYDINVATAFGMVGQSFDNHFITLYGPAASNYAAIKPEDAWNIDTKLDDGRPGTGSVVHYKATSTVAPGCVTTDNASTSVYNLNATTRLCAPFFKL